jgi:hypothetical protein
MEHFSEHKYPPTSYDIKNENLSACKDHPGHSGGRMGIGRGKEIKVSSRCGAVLLPG